MSQSADTNLSDHTMTGMRSDANMLYDSVLCVFTVF